MYLWIVDTIIQFQFDVIHDLKVKNINVDYFESTRNIYLWHLTPLERLSSKLELTH